MNINILLDTLSEENRKAKTNGEIQMLKRILKATKEAMNSHNFPTSSNQCDDCLRAGPGNACNKCGAQPHHEPI